MGAGTGSARVVLLELGAVTAVAEAVLLREGMTAFAGSELAWSLVLTAWLAGVAAGARLGGRVRAEGWRHLLPSLVVALAAGGVVLLRALPVLAGTSPGETAPVWGSLWVWPAAVLPPAFAGGFAFPVLAAGLGQRAPARAYALEAAGACGGGLLFTFALAPHGTAATLLLTLGGAAAASLRRRRWLALLPLVAAAAAAAPAARGLEALTWRWSRHPGSLAAWAETRHQRLELAAGPPLSLYADGRLVASYPDPWQAGIRGHLFMLLSPHPRRVLAVGAVADGTVEVLLRHPLEHLDLVEEDPRLLELLPAWYGPGMAQALADPRVHRLARDPLRALERGGPWDLVLLLDPDPSTLRRNRTRTREFFSRLHGRLARGGRVVVATGLGDTYLGGAAGELLAIEAATLGSVFAHVAAVPGERVLLVAGDGPLEDVRSPRILADRWTATGLRDPVFGPEILPVLLDPLRAAGLRRFQEHARGAVNRAAEPAAVLPAMALAEGRASGRLVRSLLALRRLSRGLILAAAGLLALMVAGTGLARPRLRGETAAFVIGFASMGIFVILLAAWQSSRGSVYTEIGALTGGFMIGAAAASQAQALSSLSQGLLSPLLAAFSLLALLLAAGLPFHSPLTVPFLLLAGGALTGAAFPGAAALAGSGRPTAAAARGFSSDEAGAAAGALLTGLLIPAAGAPILALSLALILAAGALATLRQR